jgi:hypothetical protein
MPFNLLLLPLLAGFLLISRTNIWAYATSLHSKEILLLYASVAGLILLCVSRIVCFLLLKCEFGVALGEMLHRIAPFPYIGTALGTLLLSGAIVLVLNWLEPISKSKSSTMYL